MLGNNVGLNYDKATSTRLIKINNELVTLLSDTMGGDLNHYYPSSFLNLSKKNPATRSSAFNLQFCIDFYINHYCLLLGFLNLMSSSILVVFHFGRLPFWSSSFLVIFQFRRPPFRSSSISVFLHLGRPPILCP